MVIEQIQADPQFLDKLTTHGPNRFGATLVDVAEWNEAAKRKLNLWRLKAIDSTVFDYRAIYGYHWQTKQLCILAVVHRSEIDYDDLNHPLSKRILEDWRSITS
ncbi:MAG: hypothetical protein HY749_19265 [Gammaproteobacteria bacterium]|nr:hypothetical protein [Gammaproteobacteria bacterium]